MSARGAPIFEVVAAAAAIAFALLALAGCGSHSPGGSSPSHGTRSSLTAIWGQPTNGTRPRALLLMIRGGGWKGPDPAGTRAQAVISQLFQRLGYETLTFDYRKGAPGIADAEDFYEQARKRVGPHLPICAIGPSAGGHIALMLATRYPDLACVIDFDGPTDLVSLAHQPGGGTANGLALDAFGKDALAKFSPVRYARRIRAAVLLLFAQSDPIVPVAQGYEMKKADPRAQLLVLPPGSASFVHSAGGGNNGVAPAAKQNANKIELKFLATAAG